MWSSSSRRSGLLAVLGGALWVPYGVLEMLEPWGADVTYRDNANVSTMPGTTRCRGVTIYNAWTAYPKARSPN